MPGRSTGSAPAHQHEGDKIAAIHGCPGVLSEPIVLLTPQRGAAVAHVFPPARVLPKVGPPTAHRNRILMLCTALGDKDTPQWPFWKWQQLKRTRAVQDLAMLAVTRQDSYIATIVDGRTHVVHLGYGRRTVEPQLLKAFVDHYYRPNSYFVYGGHGVSDRIEFNSHHRMQVHELAACLGEHKFLGILFDACLMASLDTAYYLRNNTRWVGASEGYMWEEDTWSEKHMFNPYTATLMARDSDGGRVLRLTGEEYTRKSDMADFSLIDTTHAEALWNRVLKVHSSAMNAMIELKPEVAAGVAPVEVIEDPTEPLRRPRTHVLSKHDRHARLVPVPDFPAAQTATGDIVPRDHLHRSNFNVPNSLFPEEWEDDHIVDLGAFVKDDPITWDLFQSVVSWHYGPRSPNVYSPDVTGLNYAFSQYALESIRRRVAPDIAAAIAARYVVAASLAASPPAAVVGLLTPPPAPMGEGQDAPTEVET